MAQPAPTLAPTTTTTLLNESNTTGVSGGAGPFSLFVFHLPPEADDTTLRVLFEPFGYVESVKVVKGKGFGFVNFER